MHDKKRAERLLLEMETSPSPSTTLLAAGTLMLPASFPLSL
jgi:hypothetical protein